MRSLLPGSSKTEKYTPLDSIYGPRHTQFHKLTLEEKQKVRLLELGSISTPILLVDQDYNLIMTDENYTAWRLCRICRLSAVLTKVIHKGETDFTVNRLLLNAPMLEYAQNFLDENQLDLPRHEQELLLAEPTEPLEEEPYEEEEDNYDDRDDEGTEPDRT